MNNPWIILAIVLAIAGAGWAGHHKGYQSGVAITQASYEKRDNEVLTKANATIQKLQSDARDTERMHAESDARTSQTYQTELANVKTQSDRKIAAIRAGTLVLRDPGATFNQPSSSSASPSSAAASGCHGASSGEFSREVSEFLVQFAAEADQNTQQLTACQSLILKDRE